MLTVQQLAGGLVAELIATHTDREASMGPRSDLPHGATHFHSSMMHQLKSPLCVIQGYSELLLARWEDLPDEEKFRQVDRVSQAARNLHLLVEHSLEALRRDAQGSWSGTASSSLELNEALLGICLDLTGSYPALRFVPCEHAVPVEADDQSLAIICHHLIENAHFHGVPGSEIEVRIDDDSSSAFVRILVINYDNGGQQRLNSSVFEPFMRPYGNRMDGQGSGLGLYTVAMLARAMLGTVRFSQDFGEHTTTFSVGLPRPPASVGNPG